MHLGFLTLRDMLVNNAACNIGIRFADLDALTAEL
jgi:hypothetical protein